jgi:hypothetical protein
MTPIKGVTLHALGRKQKTPSNAAPYDGVEGADEIDLLGDSLHLP